MCLPFPDDSFQVVSVAFGLRNLSDGPQGLREMVRVCRPGGRVAVLGPTGRNFAAGMSGGIAYVLDEAGDFAKNHCNREMVEIEELVDSKDLNELRRMIENHARYTQSTVAKRILDTWQDTSRKFVKIMPIDYKRALSLTAKQIQTQKSESVFVSNTDVLERL